MTKKPAILASALVLAAIALGGTLAPADEKKDEAKKETQTEQPKKTDKVKKTDTEWKKQLTAEQYRVLREGGTERGFGKAYEDFHYHKEGTYFCAGCGAELFTSNEKFDSGCGWPSFYDPSKAKNITEHVDTTAGMVRTEVVCSVCDGHLGHVFAGEGYKTPTDKRYCINAAALRYVPAGKAAGTGATSRKPAEKDGEKSGKAE